LTVPSLELLYSSCTPFLSKNNKLNIVDRTIRMLLPPDSPVIQDLLEALQDEEMTDVVLEGHDQVPVPACRFVLAARSSVLRRMLYGNFKESTSSKILLHEYDSVILEAIVEWCCRNEISKFRLYIHRTAVSARRLVQLYKAADYLALVGLAKMVAQMAHNLTTRFPPLACAVYDEADLHTKISQDALEMIEKRPYVTLPPDSDTEGGIACLTEHKLISIYEDSNVQAGELFLFQMLKEWLQCRNEDHDSTSRGAVPDGEEGERQHNDFATVRVCASHLKLENIEPHDLLTLVSPSGFCDPNTITQALTHQALKASKTRVWSLSSRGPDIERILVEGAGSKDANGIYYRVDGLANGELYSKREISCGQQYVYTLSISLNKTLEEVECRIFCSKLLTHNAVARLANKNTNRTDNSFVSDAHFQPILQVIDTGEGKETGAWIQLSDGEHFIYASLAPRLRTATRGKELVQNTLVKVLGYEKCVSSDENTSGATTGHVYLQLTKLSIISQDPGHRFGNPVYYYDDFGDDEWDEDEDISSAASSLDDGRRAAMVVNPHPCTTIVDQSSLESLVRPTAMAPAQLYTRRPCVSESQALHELYCCNYEIRNKPVDSKVPNVEWQTDAHGIGPGPRCRWIPASDVSPDDASSGGDNITSSSSVSTEGKRATVASFNSFAASVVPLPVQSQYILSPTPENSKSTTASSF